MKNTQTSMIRLCVLAILVQLTSLNGQDKAPATFLLEGQMLDRAVGVSGQCQFRAELWDQKAGYGARIGPVQVYDVALEQGRFRVNLNAHGEFGPGGLELTGTIGQPDTGSATGSGGLTLLGGFWGAPGSGYRIYLPLVSKSP